MRSPHWRFHAPRTRARDADAAAGAARRAPPCGPPRSGRCGRLYPCGIIVRQMTLDIRPIQGEFCAEVLGADLARPVDDAIFAEIERAWTRHSILVFRDVRMTPEQQIAFSRR